MTPFSAARLTGCLFVFLPGRIRSSSPPKRADWGDPCPHPTKTQYEPAQMLRSPTRTVLCPDDTLCPPYCSIGGGTPPSPPVCPPIFLPPDTQWLCLWRINQGVAYTHRGGFECAFSRRQQPFPRPPQPGMLNRAILIFSKVALPPARLSLLSTVFSVQHPAPFTPPSPFPLSSRF